MTRQHRLVIGLLALSVFLLPTACRESAGSGELNLFDLENRRTITGTDAMAAMRGARLILVGEHHTDPSHHKAQLDVVRATNEKSIAVSIGMEMFRKDQQETLDRWVAGDIDEADFEEIYLDNWNYPWLLYRDLFVYARAQKIPMIGLNVPKGITRQVARKGFSSLSDAQRGELEGVTCNVTREYRDFIRSAFGAHGHGNMDFIRFCEAQLVWDTAMAINAVKHLEKHPDRVMVLLAGSGHARKMGIPNQFQNRSSMRSITLLPHTPGIFDPDNLTAADADFIIMP